MGPSAQIEALHIQKVQNRAFYFIESAPIEDWEPSAAQLNVAKVITYDRVILVHTIVNHGWKSQKGFSYVCAKVWNDIPNDIRNMESTRFFTQKLKTYLLS